MIESVGLFLWSLAESIFLPIPPDALLMGLTLKGSYSGLFYGAITTVGSVIGALIGYAIGMVGGRRLLERWVKQASLQKVEDLFNKYDVWVVMIAGFTPIPYKIFAISAGVFKSDIPRFVIASFIGRGLRFMLEAYLVMVYGAKIIEWLQEYFNLTSLVLVGVIVVTVLLVSYLKSYITKRYN